MGNERDFEPQLPKANCRGDFGSFPLPLELDILQHFVNRKTSALSTVAAALFSCLAAVNQGSHPLSWFMSTPTIPVTQNT